MESADARDSRWQQVMDVQSEFDEPSEFGESSVVLPRLVGREGRSRQASPRAVDFAQALACEVGWSGISEARARRAARTQWQDEHGEAA